MLALRRLDIASYLITKLFTHHEHSLTSAVKLARKLWVSRITPALVIMIVTVTLARVVDFIDIHE